MEILYFIIGILSTIVGMGLNQLSKLKKQNEDMLNKYQHHLNITSIKSADLSELVEDYNNTMVSLQSHMEMDQYKNLTKTNEKLERISKDYYTNLDTIRNRDKQNEQQTARIFSEISQLKNNIKALGANPDMLSRY